jgi:hypothetical protein
VKKWLTFPTNSPQQGHARPLAYDNSGGTFEVDLVVFPLRANVVRINELTSMADGIGTTTFTYMVVKSRTQMLKVKM